jgi:hypothetical protein
MTSPETLLFQTDAHHIECGPETSATCVPEVPPRTEGAWGGHKEDDKRYPQEDGFASFKFYRGMGRDAR